MKKSVGALSLLIFIVALQPLPLQAAGYGEVEIPWKIIIAQVINLTIFLSVVTFLVRKKVASYFKERYQNYYDLVNRAEKAREEAEKIRSEIQTRLQKLETTADESVERAREEAQAMSAKLEQEAKDLEQRLKSEALKTADIEVEKAKDKLRQELLELSLKSAEEALAKTVGGPEQKRLQEEFVTKIQVVNS